MAVKITEAEFRKLYLDDNLTLGEIAKIYHCSLNPLWARLKKWDIKKDPDKAKEAALRAGRQTCLERYGVENPSQSPEVRQKREQTCLERYGYTTSALSPEVREKMAKSLEDHYGVKNSFASKEIRDKGHQTTIERYGENPYRADGEIHQRRVQTWRERYGVDNPMRSEEGKEHFRQSFETHYGEHTSPSNPELPLATREIMNDAGKLRAFIDSHERKSSVLMAQELECSEAYFRKRCHALGCADFLGIDIKDEHEIQDLLEHWGIHTEKRKRGLLGRKEIDVYCPDYKVGIEFNGVYWHSEALKTPTYHQEKSLLAEQNGIFLYHIFEYEWDDPAMRDKIIANLKNVFGLNSRKVYARDTQVKEVPHDERKDFLNQYHLQGDAQSSCALGLYMGDELLSVMTFCKPRFGMGKNKYDWELVRYCSKADVSVVGGASKLFKHFLMSHKGTIVSYSNIAKTRGTLYAILGFEFEHVSAPNYVWYKNEHEPFFTRYQTQMKGEKKIMEQQGYRRIFDSGNKVWVYKK